MRCTIIVVAATRPRLLVRIDIERGKREEERGQRRDSTSLTVMGGIETPLREGVAYPERGKLGVVGVPTPEGSSSTMKRTR